MAQSRRRVGTQHPRRARYEVIARTGPAKPRSRSEWGRLVRAWLASGDTARQFCDQRPSLNPSSLKWWAWNLGLTSKRRSRRRGTRVDPIEPGSHEGFLPVTVVTAPPVLPPLDEEAGGEAGVEVRLRTGHWIRVAGKFSVELFREIVRVLEDTR